MLWMLRFTVACILARFNILPPVDNADHPKIPKARHEKRMVL